jgi:dTDP-4-amino-4,6-dideoxygalactose transaminase
MRGARVGALKAILPVHVFGQPADMDPLTELAGPYDLRVIEDACEAVGARYKGRFAGTLGDAGVFAFYPNKQATTGEGGLIVTNQDRWSGLCKSLRNQGRDVFDSWLNHARLGFNYRLDEMSAALGAVQISRLDELLDKRARVASWYTEQLSGVPGIATPVIVPSTTRMSWFVYVVRVAPWFARPTLMAELAGRGIPTRPYFSPIHLQPYYVRDLGYSIGSFPVAEALGRTSLALPFSSVMSEHDVTYVCDRIQRVMRAAADSRTRD